MSNFGKLLKLVKFAPMVIGLIKQLRGGDQDHQHLTEEILHTQEALEELKKRVSARFDSIDEENTRLKTRIRELESSFTTLRVLMYPVGVFALVAFVLAIIAIIMFSAR